MDTLNQLNDHTYVLLFEDKSTIDRLLRHTDEDAVCIDVGMFEALKSAITEKYGIKEYPALIYRGDVVYDGENIEKSIELIDKNHVQRINLFLENFILKNGITVFVKGTIENPYCKYTKRLVALFKEHKIENTKDFNIFTDSNMRYYMKKINNWPTFPQIYINGEFVGGLDIFVEMLNEGKLKSFYGLN